jgi:glycosyltransferase involved in cell wall biosynthesis
MVSISVIVPIYNTGKYLGQCLTSILNQSFYDFELICINDGSTDNSIDILSSFAEKDGRIKIINRDKPSGSAAVPRNIGIETACGKYVIFLDSDDWFDTSMFEKMFRCAEQNNADLVMCDNYSVLYPNNVYTEEWSEIHHEFLPDKTVFSYKDIPDRIYQISNAAVWHKLILRELIVDNNLKFQENVPILDDILFVNLLLLYAERICIVDERLVFYRKLRIGSQTSVIEKHYQSIFISFERLFCSIKEAGIFETVKGSLVNWTINMFLWWYYSIKNYDIAQRVYYLYKNEYWHSLGIDNVDVSILTEKNKNFYEYIMQGEFHPSVDVILYSISPLGANLVLYGGGQVGQSIFKYLEDNGNYHVVLWCDSNALNIGNSLITPPDKIINCEFDAVLIAIASSSAVNEVKKYLNNIGVNDEKIFVV